MTFAPQGVIDVLPSEPFHVSVTSFSENAMHLQKYMELAYATRPPTSVITASSASHHYFSIKNPPE